MAFETWVVINSTTAILEERFVGDTADEKPPNARAWEWVEEQPEHVRWKYVVRKVSR